MITIIILILKLVQVFPCNVMPANAAAWYMAKRKFNENQPFDQQLLPFLLKKFPDNFKIFGNQAGLHTYFAHKVDEFGVYFFSPRYNETTEPFHASLREV